MVWPSRNVRKSAEGMGSASRGRGPKRRRRNARHAERSPAAFIPSLESLEGRRVLAVSAVAAGGILVISMDAANDQAVLQYDGTNYTVEDGSATVIGTFATASITNGIQVDGDADTGQEFVFKAGSTALSQTLIVGSQVETAQVNAAITNAPDVTLRAGEITLAADITTTGAQLFTGPVTLSANTTLQGTTVTNSSTITGGGKSFGITGNAVVNGAISGVTNYSVSGTTTLGANVATTGTQTYTGAVTLSKDTTLQGTTVTNSSTITGGGKSLTVSGNAAVDGAISGVTNYSVSGTTALGADVTTTGTQSYTGAVTLSKDTTLVGTTVTNSSTITGGGKSLTVSGNAAVDGAISGVTNYSVSGTTALGANVTTTGTQAYTGAVTLSKDTTLQGTTVTNSSTITGGGKSLTITGNAVVNGAISGVTNYAVSGTTALGVDVITTDTQTYTGLVTLAGDATLQGSTPTFSTGIIGNSKNLSLDFSGDTTVDGAKITGVKNLETANGGSTLLTGTITTTGTQSYGDNVTLIGTTILQSGANAILFSGTVDSQTDGSFGLTVTNTSTTTFTFAVGGGQRLASLTGSAEGTIEVKGGTVTTSGNQAYAGTLSLGANTTLTGQDGTFSTINGNNYSLTLDFTDAVSLATVTINNVSSLTVNSAVELNGTITAAGDLSFGAVTLTGDTTLDAGAFDVTFGGTVNGAFGLTVNSLGTTTFSDVVGGTNPLTSLTTDAGGSTSISGGSITTTGAQLFGDTNVILQDATTLSGKGQTFAGTLNANNKTLTLRIEAAGISTLDGNNVSNLAGLTTSEGGTLQLKGPLTSTGPQRYGTRVSLIDDTTLDAGAANITFSAAVDGGENLTLVTAGHAEFAALVGGGTPLASLTTSAGGSTAVNGGAVTTTGDQTYQGPITFSKNTTLSAAAITFSDDADAGNNVLTATATTGAITAITANKAISASTLTLTAATGIDVHTTVTALDATVTGAGDILIHETDDITLGVDAGISTTSGTITVDATNGKIQINKSVAAGISAVVLRANDGINAAAGITAVTAGDLELTNQTANGIALPLVSVTNLAVTQDAASTVSITNAGSLGIGVGTTGIDTKGSATITAKTGEIALNQPSSVAEDATLALKAPGGITQSANGSVTGKGTVNAITSAGTGGAVILDAPGNTVANIQGATKAAGFTYVAADDVRVGGIGTQGGAITLAAPFGANITLAGALAAGTGAVSISTATAAGNIQTDGGTITTATTSGDILITTTGGGAIETPTIAATGGDVTVKTQAGGGITIANALAAGGGNVAIQTVAGGNIDSSASSVTTSNAGTINFETGTSGSIITANVQAGSGAVTLKTSGAAAKIDTTGGSVTTAGGTVAAIAGGQIKTAGIATNGGAIRLDAGSTAADAISLNGSLNASPTARVTLASSGGIDDTETAEVTASQLVVERANGEVRLNQLGNSVGALALFNQSASDNKIVSGSPMQIGVAGVATPGITTGGGNVSIRVDGNALTAVSSVVISTSGGILTLEADSIRLDQNSHLVTRLAANAADGDIAFKAANNLAAAGGVGATGTDIDGLKATGGISLEAGGVVSQEDGATVLGGALVITANGVALGDEDNNVASLEVRTDGSVVYADADDVSIAGIRGRTGARAGEIVIDTQTAGNDGSILQGGAILAGALSAFADGSVLLGNSTNDVDFFEAEAGDSNPPGIAPGPQGVLFRDANDLSLGNVVADDVPGDFGYVNIRVGGSIDVLGELTYDRETPGSLTLEHGDGGQTTFVVTSNGDIIPLDADDPQPIQAAGLTLRQRIYYVNDNAVLAPQDEYITFAIDNFFPIAIATQLPTVERRVTVGPAADEIVNLDFRIAIDGSGAVSYELDDEGRPTFDVDGNPITTNTPVDGLTLGYGNAQGLGSNGSLIRGLVVYGFSGAAIVVNSSDNTITNNWIGITRGSETKGNGGGIEVVSSKVDGTTVLASSNTIDGNVISGNDGAGISIRDQATLTTVVNNLIGTNPFGTIPIGNAGYGIEVVGSSLNTIGGVDQGNTIVNNGSRNGEVLVGGGIRISGTLTSESANLANTVLGNTISNNTGDGIAIDTSLGNVIGDAGIGNIIQDNAGAGVFITAARATSLAAGNLVRANKIALNDLGGIVLENTAFQTISGGNEIMSNGLFADATGGGIAIRSTKADSVATNNVIVGNYIGTDSSAEVDGGNADAGIVLEGAVNTIIGTGTAGDMNVVSFNRLDGVRITDGLDPVDADDEEDDIDLIATGNRIRGNSIRFNSTLANEAHAGVSISGGSRNTVGGTNPGEANLISDNNAHGVLISGGSNKAHTDGNRIAGNTITANELDGVVVSDSDFDSIDGGNVIAANGRDGVSVVLASQSTRIFGNRIGVDADGLVAGNSRNGVYVEAATGIAIGDAAASNRNVIAGNGAGPGGGHGIYLQNGANNVTIRNNLIGLTPNGTLGANTRSGIRVTGGEAAAIAGLVIGGTGTNEGNVVSGNGLSGIVLEETEGAIVRGNRIGTDIPGALAIANGGSGIEVIGGSKNVIGGTAATAGNLISGNAASGVSVDGGTDHEILGNRIGTNAAGAAVVANLAHGVEVSGKNTTVTIGGLAAGASNTIAGNAIDGIHVAAGKATVLGNYIGTNASSGSSLGNDGDGIEVSGGEATAIGDGSASGRNVISGNEGRGILLSGGSAAMIQGNFIGVNAAGTAALANGTQAAPQAGIRIAGATDASVSLGNVVSGNTGNGIELVGANTVRARVIGNRVGTNATGAAAIANGAAGIAFVAVGAADVPPVDEEDGVVNRNTIGGLAANEGNLISGNASHGIAIIGSTNALIAQNTIGLTLNGGLLANAGSGVAITGSTDIDVTYRNQIAGNNAYGVLVTGGSGNSIGADADQANKGLANGNTITRNKLDGVRIEGNATDVTVAANTIGVAGQGNGGRGISVLASSGVVVGGLTVEDIAYGNAIVGNVSDGVGVLDATGVNTLYGNRIQGNLGRGVVVDNSDSQIVGSTSEGGANIIVLNKQHGIELRNDTDNTDVIDNFIGTTSALTGGLGNELSGLRIAGSSSSGNRVQRNRIQGNARMGVVIDATVNNLVGGFDEEGNPAGNVIVLQGQHGVILANGATGNTVSSNFIGTDEVGTKSLGNRGDGISVQGSVGNTIGGTEEGDGNTIRGNQAGINLVSAVAANLDAGNVVAGNTIAANLREGIRLFTSSFNTIGLDEAANTINDNAGDGISIATGSSANIVQGNFVGANGAGNRGAGIRVVGSNLNTLRDNTVENNQANGIVVAGSAKTVIGGLDVEGDGNTISANRGDGILLTDAAQATVIVANDITANTGNGISVQRSTGNAIGVANVGNTIAGNLLDGVLVSGVSATTSIYANAIGGDGDAANPNGGAGIRVSGAFGTAIGGTRLGEGNTVGVNTVAGILVEAAPARTAAAATRIYGNEVSNTDGIGVLINGSSNQIVGGLQAGQANTLTGNRIAIRVGNGATGAMIAGNVISNTSSHGIVLSAGSGTTVTGNVVTGSAGDGIRVMQAAGTSVATGHRIIGNFLGTTAGGGAGLGNGGAGVRLSGGSRFVTVGGPGSGNMIGSNAVGVAIEGGSSSNVVESNFIGTDAVGLADDLGNQGAGVEITASLGNTVRNNLIRRNDVGVRIADALARSVSAGNGVLGNTIRDNTSHGVQILGGGRHMLGGTAVGAANTIIMNGASGIDIAAGTTNNASVGNVIRGNFIGTNAAREVGLGNAANGITISGGSGNEISSGNVIARNKGDGLSLLGSSSNSIGGTATTAGNTLTANEGNGVRIASGSSSNLVAGNQIGGHSGAGVAIEDADSQGNVIGIQAAARVPVGRANTIRNNRNFGVLVDAAARNQICGNLLTGNTANGAATTGSSAGIQIQNGGNPPFSDAAFTPVLTAATFARRKLTISGFIGAAAGTQYWVDVFTNGPSAAGAQAATLIARILVRTTTAGRFTASVTLPTGTALAVGDQLTITATSRTGNTSMLSAPLSVA